MNPQDLNYSQEHEWVRMEPGGVAVLGITEYAVESLGDVVFLDLPSPNVELTQFEKIGEIESVKAVSDIYSPINGKVIERNDRAMENPQIVNESPYGSGWLLKVAVADASGIDVLMTTDQYNDFLATQG